MMKSEPNLRPIMRAALLAAVMFFACGRAFAQVQGVQGYVVINPIAVCDSSGNCPTFGMSCGLHGTSTYSCTQYKSPSAANQTTQSQLSTPIGFVDADNNRNLTRATWIRSGLDVVFFPIQQWNSDNISNANPWSGLNDAVTNPPKAFTYTTTNYQTIHTVNVLCNDGNKVLTSPDLQALTQRKVCDDRMGPNSSIVAAANPPTAPTGGGKLVPLALNGCSTALPCLPTSNAVDMLFLTTISPAPGASGAINGLSWLNHNGIAIAKSGIAPVGTPPFGVIPHELGHGMALTHTDYGATADGAKNLMMVGGPRTEPSTSGCFGQGISYGGQANTNGGALYDLAYAPAVPTTCTPAMNPVAENLTLSGGSPCGSIDPTQCTTQQGAVLLSGFVNLSLAATATAGGGSFTAATATAQTQGSNSKGGIPFTVDSSNGGGETGATIGSVIFALAPGLDFQGNTPAAEQPLGSPDVHIINQVRTNGNTGIGNLNCVKQVGLAPPSIHCLQIFFTVGAFTVDKSINFTLKIVNSSGPLTLSQASQLAGTGFTVLSDNGKGGGSTYATTTTFESMTGEGGTVLLPADSRFPDLSIPNQVTPQKFVGATQTPCSPYTLSRSDCKAGELPQGPDPMTAPQD
jgi:hypothetical protein